jgi:5'-3' exonuclease
MNGKEDTVIVTKDKDLWQVGGNHLNIATGQLFTSHEDPGKLKLKNPRALVGYGFKWFAAQCLLGDAIDNIKGIKGLGPVNVYRLLDKLNTKQDIWKAVQEAYAKAKRDDLLMNAQMLWILREEGGYFDETKI